MINYTDYTLCFSYVIVVEHDLSVLDYLSDFICCLYGKPGAYGVVTLPFSVREGINIFLAGFVPTENLRFRDESLTFRVHLLFCGSLYSYCRRSVIYMFAFCRSLRLHKKVLRRLRHMHDTSTPPWLRRREILSLRWLRVNLPTPR